MWNEQDKGKMLDLKDIPNVVETIKEQIAIRHRLIQSMVGQLYPSIVQGEIIKLNIRMSNLTRS